MTEPRAPWWYRVMPWTWLHFTVSLAVWRVGFEVVFGKRYSTNRVDPLRVLICYRGRVAEAVFILWPTRFLSGGWACLVELGLKWGGREKVFQGCLDDRGRLRR